jgi:hypothetical protein
MHRAQVARPLWQRRRCRPADPQLGAALDRPAAPPRHAGDHLDPTVLVRHKPVLGKYHQASLLMPGVRSKREFTASAGPAGRAPTERAGAALQPSTHRRADPTRSQEARPLPARRPSHHRRSARPERGCWLGVCPRGAGRRFQARLVEVLPDEQRRSVTGFLVRELRWSKSLGIRIERVTTDNGLGYVSRLFRKARRMLRCATSTPRRTRPRPTAKPNASSRPCCESGPTPCHITGLRPGPPTCPAGSATTTSSDPNLAR